VPRLFHIVVPSIGGPVSRKWLLPCLLLSLGCSDGAVRSGSLAVQGEAEPTLLLRCEAGRVNAYLVVGPPGEGGASQIEDGAVRVDLDSVVACSENGP
jgi:hypothetical protein